MRTSLLIAGLLLGTHASSGAQVRISEFLAENASGLTDADGATSDWLELENVSAASVNLDGWFLTDDPADLDKWRIPAVNLASGARMVVFCSLKNRATPGTELHTDFSLSSSGEFLALTKPDGVTVASQFAPYPPQREDVSYGIARQLNDDVLISPLSPARWLVPTSGTLANTWTAPAFADAGWTAVSAAVGFQQTAGGPAPQAYWNFDDTPIDFVGGLAASLFGVAYSNNTPSLIGSGKSLGLSSADNDYIDAVMDVSETSYTVSFWFKTTNSGAGLFSVVDGPLGVGGHDRHLYLTGGNIGARTWNTEVIASTGKAYANGQWHHVAHVLGATQSGQKIYVDGALVASGSKAASDFNWQKRVHMGFSNDAASQYFTGEMDDLGIFNTALTAAQVLTLSTGASPLALSGVLPYVKSNVAATLYNTNPGGYLRIPFSLPRPVAEYEQILLRTRYDDGFVLYLNGTEILRRNAPAAAAFNATALSDRPLTAAITVEALDLTAFTGLLSAGPNVLAVQALNHSAGSPDFLFEPQLIARDIVEEVSRYMSPPSPRAGNTSGFFDFVADVNFSVDRGWFTTPFTTVVSCLTPGATLVYTTDGSPPSLTNGTQVQAANSNTPPAISLGITNTTTLRAAAFKPGWQSTPPDTQTYIFRNLVRHQAASQLGLPATWAGGVAADYGVDQNVVNTTLPGYSFEEAIAALPTLSIVGASADIFAAPSGIYYDTGQRGLASEKRISVEFFEPGSAAGEWQVEAGLRSHGNSSRGHSFTTKHPFRLYFRREYGDSKLNARVFPDSDVREFNRLLLRACSTDSWPVVDGPPRWVNEKGTYMRDAHMRQAMRDLGNVSGHSRYVQLFFNGLYWGVYEISERPEESFCESYLGGAAEEYDVIKDFAELASGNLTAWTALMNLANPVASVLSTDAGYWQVQGRNPDGTVNAGIEPLLHMQSFIDYLILHIAGGAEDWPNHNYWAARRRGALSDGFHFLPWDQEISYDNTTRTGSHIFPNTFELVNAANSPAILYDRLRQGPAFKQRFRDRVHALFFNGGPLTAANSRARWASLQAGLDLAIVGESARWGDSKQAPAFKRETTWLTEMNFMQAPVTGFWDVMWPVQIQRFGNVGLYPAVSQPAMSLAGGVTAAGSSLYLSAAAGTIYYTVDGTDPLTPGGNPSPSALVFTNGNTTSEAIPKNSQWAYLVTPAAADISWKNVVFDDSTWPQGAGQLGYGDGDEGTVIGFGPNTAARYITTYFRKTLLIPDPSVVTAMKVKLLRDDGAVVYVNGIDVFRSNMHPTNPVTYSSTASSNVGGADETSFYYEAVLNPSLLQSGNNVIAVEVHKVSASDADLSFDLALELTSQAPTTPITLNTTQTINARVLSAGQWSGLNSARFFVTSVPASALNTVISEIHYHPVNPVRPGETAITSNKDDFEFIELQNVSPTTVDLAGVQFTEGVTFRFDTGSRHEIPPSGRVLVVRNPAAMLARYGPGLPIAGAFADDTGLANGGEMILLIDRHGADIRRFSYDDAAPWPLPPDGSGPSLELISPAPSTDHAAGTNWKASFDPGGTPGLPANGMTFSRWRDLYFDPAASGYALRAAANTDADGDGYDNLVEFVLGTNPSAVSSTPHPQIAWMGDSGQSGLRFSYHRRPDTTDYVLTLEQSRNLLHWVPAPFSPLTSVTAGNGTILESVRLNDTPAAGSLLLRLKAELP